MNYDHLPSMELKHAMEMDWFQRASPDDVSKDYLSSKQFCYEHDELFERWIFMEHSDGVTIQEIKKIDMGMGGGVYIEHRYTVITDPKWYHRPLYRAFDIVEWIAPQL